MVRRSSTENFERIAHLHGKITLHQADLLDQLSIINLIQEVQPREVYNYAAQSFVPTSFQQPILTGEFTALGVARVLEAVRLVDPTIRFFQASSSEMFGKVREEPQNEHTPFWPRSPYGVAKAYGHWITVNYRESYTFSLVRAYSSITNRLCAAWNSLPAKSPMPWRRIKLGVQKELVLGNLEAMRDWGFAGDYVRACWMMLQQECARRLRHRHRQKTFGARSFGFGFRLR